jgi:hypothetical protein
MMSPRTKRSLRLAFALLAAALFVIGCLGQAERTFFDDSVTDDGGSVDGSTNESSIVVPEGGSNEGGTDAADSGDSAQGVDAGPAWTVGGVVLGLTGTGLTLHLSNGSDYVATPQGGSNVAFLFDTPIAEGGIYDVSVKKQPQSPVQSCSVSGGTGVIGQANVVTVVVNCLANQYTVGGSLTGLEGTVTLQNSVDGGAGAADSLLLNSVGTFSFAKPLPTGDMYTVKVTGHSAVPDQTCTVMMGGGTIASAPVTNVAVACATNAFSVGGPVTGLTVGDLVLTSPNGGIATVPANATTFKLPTDVLSNKPYNVTVMSAPASLTCRVTNASGTVTNVAVTDVTVKCVPKYALEQSFDTTTVPNLPGGWTTAVLTSQGSTPSPFVTTSTTNVSLPGSHTPTNSCAVDEHNNVSDIVLTSPQFTVQSDVAKISFAHAYALESVSTSGTAYDGAVLEISFDGGMWKDIIVAGGAWDPPWKDAGGNVNAGYTGYSYLNGNGAAKIVSSGFENPLFGRHVWTGISNGYKLTTVSMPPVPVGSAFAQIRFRLGTDNRGTVNGWRVDSIFVAN